MFQEKLKIKWEELKEKKKKKKNRYNSIKNIYIKVFSVDQQTNQKRFPSVCSVWEALLKLIGQDTATSLQTRQNTANQSLFKLCCIQGLFFHSHKSGKLVGFNDSRGAVSCT